MGLFLLQHYRSVNLHFSTRFCPCYQPISLFSSVYLCLFIFQFPGGGPGGLPGMPGSIPGIPVSMQQRLDLASVTMAQSLSLSRQHEHLMTLAGAGNSAAAAAAVAASAAGAAGLPGGPPHPPNPEKIAMTNVSLLFSIYFLRNLTLEEFAVVDMFTWKFP